MPHPASRVSIAARNPVAEDQRCAAQLLRRNDTGRPPPRCRDKHHFLFGQPARSDQTTLRHLRQQRHIDAPVDEEFLEPDHPGMDDLQLDHRIVPAHPGKQLRHQDRAQGRRDGEDDLAAGMRLVGPDFVAGPLQVAQDALRALEQLLPAFSEPHAAVSASEQSDLKLVFEPLDMPGQRRLGDVEMGCGTRDAAEFGDADEIVKAAQFHLVAISPYSRTGRQLELRIIPAGLEKQGNQEIAVWSPRSDTSQPAKSILCGQFP
jgi:hypothetical protein